MRGVANQAASLHGPQTGHATHQQHRSTEPGFNTPNLAFCKPTALPAGSRATSPTPLGWERPA